MRQIYNLRESRLKTKNRKGERRMGGLLRKGRKRQRNEREKQQNAREELQKTIQKGRKYKSRLPSSALHPLRWPRVHQRLKTTHPLHQELRPFRKIWNQIQNAGAHVRVRLLSLKITQKVRSPFKNVQCLETLALISTFRAKALSGVGRKTGLSPSGSVSKAWRFLIVR